MTDLMDLDPFTVRGFGAWCAIWIVAMWVVVLLINVVF